MANKPKDPSLPASNDPQASVNLNIDPTRTPILYSDIVYIKTNENGVVLDFAQQIGPSNQYSVVSRVGLSKEHAHKLIEHLEALLRAEGTSSTNRPN